MNSVHDDEYSGMRPLSADANPTESFFQCSFSLKQIQRELRLLTDQAHQGLDIDEARFDYLLKAQEHNEEYKLLLAEERLAWRDSVYEFAEQCLERTRSFVPLNIFESSLENLVALGLTPELSKRILQRQCLWLVRMSKAEIASLHESDLLGRFNSSAQHMDIIETAAIYIALPDTFNGDEQGKKRDWRDRIEENLRRMLQDNDNNQLPEGRIRNPAYDGLQFGPIEDVTSVRAINIVSGRHSHRPRRSFLEVCKTHSILSTVNVKAVQDPDSSDSERGEVFEDEYEDAGEDEEVYVVGDTSAKISEGIQPGFTSSYQTRDYVEYSDEEEEERAKGYGNFGAEEEEGEGEEEGESGNEPDAEAAPVRPGEPFDGGEGADKDEDADEPASPVSEAEDATVDQHDSCDPSDSNYRAYIDQLTLLARQEKEGTPLDTLHDSENYEAAEELENTAEEEHGPDSGRDSGEYFLVSEGLEAHEPSAPTVAKGARRRSTLRPHDPHEPGEHEYVDAHTFSETDTDDSGDVDS